MEWVLIIGIAALIVVWLIANRGEYGRIQDRTHREAGGKPGEEPDSVPPHAEAALAASDALSVSAASHRSTAAVG